MGWKKAFRKVKKAVKKVAKTSLKATTAVSKISDKAGKVVATVGKYVPPPAGDKIALVGEGIKGFSDQLDYAVAAVKGFKTPSEGLPEDDYIYVEDSNNALKSSVVSSSQPGSPQVRSSSPVVQSSSKSKGIIEWILDLFF